MGRTIPTRMGYWQTRQLGKDAATGRIRPQLLETRHHKTIPHELLTGHKPQVQVKFLPENTPAATDRLKDLSESREQVQKLLENLQNKKDARKMTEMKVGDLVLRADNLVSCVVIPNELRLELHV
jgi:hypothetical protein